MIPGFLERPYNYKPKIEEVAPGLYSWTNAYEGHSEFFVKNEDFNPSKLEVKTLSKDKKLIS